jgi:uridine kinase
MLGDVLLITDKHRDAAEKILWHVMKNKKDKFIVAISGESGSGKSELSHALARLLRKESIFAKPIHVDNFYRIHPLERTEWRKLHGIQQVVGLGELDWDKINQSVDDFRHDCNSTMPCVDLVTEQIDTLITDFKGIDMLILDGLYAVHTEGADLRVFIELTYHETKKAQVVRGKEPQNEYRMQVLEQEHQVVQSLRHKADLLVTMEYDVIQK